MFEHMFSNVRADLARARKDNVSLGPWTLLIFMKPATMAVLSYRFSRWAGTIRVPVLRQLLAVFAFVVRYVVEIISGVYISPKADIGPGLVVHTPYGVFVGATKIGKNCFLQHGVVITYGTRRIGDNAYFGPGAKVIGDVTIGNNVIVVANSLVVGNVADDTTVMGVPARISVPRGRRLLFNYEAPAENGHRGDRDAPVPGAQQD